jgi:hypothetical protein
MGAAFTMSAIPSLPQPRHATLIAFLFGNYCLASALQMQDN